MNAPFFKYGLFGDEVSLMVAFVIGVAFGFVLERAGFGNARVLAAQFYFRDLRVLKVMFTAIVTAMVGVFVLARVGVLDLSLVYLTPTFLAPQIAGGLVLGAGFIIGGYCPGTSCVSAATGRIDGMVYLAGILGGLVGFAEVYPFIAGFAHSTGLGQVTLAGYFDLSYGALVLAVVLMALGAFVAAEWAERKIGGKPADADALLAPTRRLVPVRRLALGFIAVGVIAAVAGSPYRGPFARVDAKQLALESATGAQRVEAEALARRVMEGRNDFLLVDVREPAAFERYHLPGAINVPLATLADGSVPRNERLICYSDSDTEAAQATLLLRSLGHSSARFVAGGLQGWQSNVLFPKPPAADASPEERRQFEERAAIARYFGGSPQGDASRAQPTMPELPKFAPTRSATPSQAPAPARKRKEGC